ncbi:pulmonary surfactant-associated protein D-like [Nelusetta ayraudi]|uniref:pulmonary surfactant-associated protein D-like n=1 Tax=Nelusetta ayraudi TaxID=303726 RepID=UPI003F70F0AB
MFAVLPEVKTWSGAQAYCRLHAADLASARSPAENEAVRQLIGQQEEESHPLFWIGLFKSKVRSSDGAYSSFHNWYRTQPNKDGWCVLATSLGKWYDRGCANKLMCFYCYARKSMKFIVRLQFKSNSKFSSFSDSALTDDILSKIQNKYDKVKLQWRVEPDGKVFHKRD